jgi:hypothetical protein
METDEEADRLDDSILQVLELLGPALLDESDSSDSESETEQRQLLYQALEMLDNEGLDDEDDPHYEALLDAELAGVKKEEAKGWFPFKKKEVSQLQLFLQKPSLFLTFHLLFITACGCNSDHWNNSQPLVPITVSPHPRNCQNLLCLSS